MRVGLYARVSTLDKDQDPETQLVALREFVRAQGWEIFREYVDHAPARDLTHRTAWRELLDDAARKRFKTVVVFRLDRAFRSVKDMHDTLGYVGAVGDRFQERARAVRHRDGCGKTAAEPSGGGGRVRAGDDKGASASRDG